jgi:hypothetical protein
MTSVRRRRGCVRAALATVLVTVALFLVDVSTLVGAIA